VFLLTNKVNIKVLKDLELDCLISQLNNSLLSQARKTANIAITKLTVVKVEPE
jgi:hypothetical protein